MLIQSPFKASVKVSGRCTQCFHEEDNNHWMAQGFCPPCVALDGAWQWVSRTIFGTIIMHIMGVLAKLILLVVVNSFPDD